MKLEKIEPGMILYDRHKYRMGNTTMRSVGEWEVRVLSVNPGANRAIVSWNGNPPQTWQRRQLEALKTWSMYDDCAVVDKGMMGCVYSVKLKRGYKAPPPRCFEKGGGK